MLWGRKRSPQRRFAAAEVMAAEVCPSSSRAGSSDDVDPQCVDEPPLMRGGVSVPRGNELETKAGITNALKGWNRSVELLPVSRVSLEVPWAQQVKRGGLVWVGLGLGVSGWRCRER